MLFIYLCEHKYNSMIFFFFGTVPVNTYGKMEVKAIYEMQETGGTEIACWFLCLALQIQK